MATAASRLDPRISLSSVLTLVTIVGAAAASWAGGSAAIGRLEQRVADFDLRIDQRLNDLAKRLDRDDADHDTLVVIAPIVKRLAEKEGRP